MGSVSKRASRFRVRRKKALGKKKGGREGGMDSREAVSDVEGGGPELAADLCRQAGEALFLLSGLGVSIKPRTSCRRWAADSAIKFEPLWRGGPETVFFPERGQGTQGRPLGGSGGAG